MPETKISTNKMSLKWPRSEAVRAKGRAKVIADILSNPSVRPTLCSKFQSPAKTQNQSLLLQLPAELRLEILRMLMKRDGAIQSSRDIDKREGEDDTWDYYRQVALSSQVMSCCQILYTDARYILYQENKLSITVTGSRYAVLDLDLYIPQSIRQLESKEQDIFSAATQRKVLYPILGICKVISEFGSIRFSTDARSQRDLWVACRLLRHFLRGKRVEFCIPDYRVHAAKPWLNACRIWRCKEISFPQISGAKIDRLRQLIESDEEIVDQYEMVGGIDRMMKISHANASGGGPAIPYAEEFKGLAMNYEAVEIVDSKPKFTPLASQLIGNVLSSRRSALEAKVKELKEKQRVIDQHEADMRDTLQSVMD